MATAAPEIKPDYSSHKRHFCFTDEHEALRESIQSFASKELAPHSAEWEETGFPDSVFTRMGELGFLGIHFPEEYGGPGRRLPDVDRARRGDGVRQQRRPGDGSRGPHRHGDAPDPQVRLRGAQAALPRARDQGREDLLARHHRAGRRVGRRGDPHARGARRRRVRHQRRQDVHHQRRARRLHRAGDQDRFRRRLRRLLAVRGRQGLPRLPRVAQARQARDALLRHGGADLRGRPRARPRTCSARRARASTTSCGSSRASG